MKKRVAVLLAMMMAVSMTACGGEDPVPVDAGQEITVDDGEKKNDSVYATRTMAYFHKHLLDGAYTMESRYEMDGMEVISLSAVDGNRMYSKTEMDGMESILILLEDTQYILDPASKMAIKMALGAGDGGLNTQEMFAEEEENYEAAVSTGDMDVNGTTYFYEEFTVDGSAVKYCFEGDDMRYILTEMDGTTYTMEIISMEKGADADLFVVPDDYEVMAF